MISAFDLFKIGIGPSSSHTVGPMKAAAHFAAEAAVHVKPTSRVKITLYGSLAWTGRGHATDRAVFLGLAGELPETIDPDRADALLAEMLHSKRLALGGGRSIAFTPDEDLVFDLHTSDLAHPNTLAFVLMAEDGTPIYEERWCSVGGGFVVRQEDLGKAMNDAGSDVPYPFHSGLEMLAMAAKSGLTIAEMMMANELALRPCEEIEQHLDRITTAMMGAIDRGKCLDGVLPGGLTVRRRAKRLYDRLKSRRAANTRHPVEAMDWVSLYAIAVNEENASGSRIVTAPTNGAAGVVPAVLRYYRDFCDGANLGGERVFLLTATAIGGLFKRNASISGAEVGCQGEVGVACSMAAAGLTAALGGTDAQVENAAEIGMEHHLGMTCDPIGGLVQIPCIERNAFGAVKAITAASLALAGDGDHKVSLDHVMRTMRETGADMQSKYKETSLGGLAVNFVEC